MLNALLDRLTGRGDDAGGPDPSTARGRDELLAETERKRAAELEDARERLEAEEAEVPVAVAAGDADAESRAERVELRAELEDLERGLEAIREARQELRPAVLQEEAEEEAKRSRRALREAKRRATKLGRAADRLLAHEVAALAEAYGMAREASGRVREIRRELANEHDADRDFRRARELDGQLRRDAWNGWEALRALQKYSDRRRD